MCLLNYPNTILEKYGRAQYDYFRNEYCLSVNPKVSRSKEGLFCHHIDEDKAILLSTSVHAKKNPFAFQQSERLVYCNILEHLLLHIKITIEARHPNANSNESPGIGGIFLVAAHLNDYYDGYEMKRDYLRTAMTEVKDNLDDYVKILGMFVNEFMSSIHPYLKKIGSKMFVLVKKLSDGINVKNRIVLDRLLVYFKDFLIPIERLKQLEILAEQGSKDSQLELGELYMNGEKMVPDYKIAFKYFHMAAMQQSKQGHWMVGYLYDHGFGVIRDRTKAFEHYLFVAEQEHDFAEYQVGYCYLNGVGIEKNTEEAIKWLSISGDKGYLKSQLLLGDIYYYTLRRHKKNVLEAIKWYGLAAQQNDSTALMHLGHIYLNGKGVPQDLAKAKTFYEEAKRCGNKFAGRCIETIMK
ncbi:MAG: sel1 repeat family protein [Acholeplasmataceae bacterium]|nr:sel1 repeat family protein [Acholeplasmataceae bacterium]